jgi:hypothetical protein
VNAFTMAAPLRYEWRMKCGWCWFGFMALLACGDDAPSPERGALHGGTDGLCHEEPVTTALAWDETSSLGLSPHEAFAKLAGSCQAAFHWSAAGLSSVSLTPAAGDTRITVSVEIDEGSARLLEPPQAYCGTSLQVDADVRFETEDGVFAEGGRVTLLYFKESAAPVVSLTRTSSELEGSLRASLKSNQSLSVQFRGSGADQACAGELTMPLSETHGNMGSAVGGPLGRWSNSGCELGKEGVAFDGSSALGDAILNELDLRWRDVSFTGRWDGGEETSVKLAAKTTAQRACAETTGTRMVTVPVQVTYASGDGRVASHDADAHLNFFRTEDDALSKAQLVLSETMTCASGATKFQNLDLSCAEFKIVEAQLLINRYLGRSASDELRLELYEYASEGEAGAADAVEHLTSAPR